MLHNKPTLGSGIYTPPEISLILRIPPHRIRWYIDEVWDNRFGMKLFNERYSWNLRQHKAVNFLVLVEFKVVILLKDVGLSARKILKARNAIATELNLPYPFATSHLLANAKNIWYKVQDDVVDADGTGQMNFVGFIENYTRCMEFDPNTLFATRFWPDGKESSIVVDPHHQFGQPTIFGTNVSAETIYSIHQSGETVPTLCRLYKLEEKQILDALKFYQHAA